MMPATPVVIVIAALAVLLVIAALWVARGLRDYRRAERANAEAMAKHRTIMQSLADSIIIINEHGLIQSFSPAAEKTFGYTAEEVVGKNVSILMPSPDREQHDRYIREYIESGWTTSYREHLMLTGDAQVVRPQRETIALRKDGSRFPIRLLVSEVDTGTERFFVGLLSDITEQNKAAEELREAKEKAEEANKIIEAQKRRMQDELDVGRQIQMSLVPTHFPSLANTDLWGTLKPSREVGGDFYDFFIAGDGSLWLCIGDVSGKGVPAALLMAVTKTLIKSSAGSERSPGKVFTRVNDELSADNDTAMFVTAFIGRLDLSTGGLVYSNAGHNPPLIRTSGHTVERLATRHGPVLGALERVSFGESVIDLQPGDTLLMYTDGVSEALNKDEQFFGEHRLREVARSAEFETARELADSVVSAVETFAAGADQADDITLLALRYGNGSVTPTTGSKLMVTNDLDALDDALSRVGVMVADCGGDLNVQNRFAMAFDELLSNIIQYGFPSDGKHLIECQVRREPDGIVAVIIDDGIEFDPLAVPAPDISQPLEARRLGGLGIHLVRRTFDGLRYERRNGKNILTLRRSHLSAAN